MPAWLTRLRLRLTALLSSTPAREVSEELQLHIDLLTDEYRAQGASEIEARARAVREFGNVTRLGESIHDVRSLPAVESWVRDLGYALRQLRRSPGVSAVAIVSLALGIGANTAIFSIVNGLIVRTLPVPDPQRLAALSIGDDAINRVDGSRWSYAFWQAFREQGKPFAGSLAWSSARLRLSSRGEVDPIDGVLVDGAFFSTLGVPALIGRTLGPSDDVPGGGSDGGPVAMISHRFWQRRFGGASDIVGKPLVLQRTTFTVVGVTPPFFTGLEIGESFDVALSLSAEPLIRGSQSFLNPPFDRLNYWLRIGVRLQPGQSIEQGSSTVRGLQPELREAAFPHQFPQLKETFLREPLSLVPAATGLSRLREIYRRPLAILLVVVALVLLLACVNVANLLLARATTRSHELAVRVALGATRWRVARQLLLESLLLTTLGTVAGVLLATWAARALVAQFSTTATTVALDVTLDSRVLAMTIVAALVTTILCGTAPALRVRRASPIDALRDWTRVPGDRRSGVSSTLLAVQVALSLILVVGTGLFVGTFARLSQVPLGFDRDRVLLINANASQAGVRSEDRASLFQRLVDAVGTVAGVAHAAASTSSPVSATDAPVTVAVIGDANDAQESRQAKSVFVTPGWFATYGVPVRAGRDVALQDAKGTLPVMLVNDAFVTRFFPGRSPLGESAAISLGVRGELALGSRTIVGVVGNAVYRSLRDPAPPTVYFPLAQWDYPVPMSSFIAIGVRAATVPPTALSRDVSEALAAIEPRLALTVRPLADQVHQSVQQEQLLAALSTLFGMIALFLAGIGLYGVTNASVAQRRAEIGIRVAVGASAADLVRLLLSRVLTPVGVGVVIGAGLSVWLSRFVTALLYGVTPGDPATIVGAAIVLVAVALCAAWVPARRALRIDPAEVLRVS